MADTEPAGQARIKLAVVLSDLHCGSIFGLCPPEVPLDERNTYRAGPFQQWLWDMWQEVTNQWLPNVIGDDPFVVIVNGDAIEGVHHGTTQIVSPEPRVHRDIARDCLKPLAETCEHLFIVKGTRSHVGTMTEESIGVELGAERDCYTGREAWWRLKLSINNTSCRFTHHIGSALRSYLEASQLSIMLNEEQIAAARANRPLPRVVGRAHRHRYGEYKNADGLCFVTPAWQGATEYVHKVVTTAEEAQVGLVVLDWRNASADSIPATHAWVKRQPPMKEFSL